MTLTNKHSLFYKKHFLSAILYVLLTTIAFPVKSQAINFSLLMNIEKKVTTQNSSNYNNPEKLYTNISKEKAFDNNSKTNNHNTKNLKQLNILLTLMVIILCFSIIILWKKNRDLGHETSQIKSSLNQYLFNTTSNEDLKSIQEEHKQQALILNERQQKIVDLMAFGYSNKQIADKLFISENTVKYHIKNIYQVLHVKDRKQLWLSQS